jgi:hypothetical protein
MDLHAGAEPPCEHLKERGDPLRADRAPFGSPAAAAQKNPEVCQPRPHSALPLHTSSALPVDLLFDSQCVPCACLLA